MGVLSRLRSASTAHLSTSQHISGPHSPPPLPWSPRLTCVLRRKQYEIIRMQRTASTNGVDDGATPRAAAAPHAGSGGSPTRAEPHHGHADGGGGKAAAGHRSSPLSHQAAAAHDGGAANQ